MDNPDFTMFWVVLGLLSLAFFVLCIVNALARKKVRTKDIVLPQQGTPQTPDNELARKKKRDGTSDVQLIYPSVLAIGIFFFPCFLFHFGPEINPDHLRFVFLILSLGYLLIFLCMLPSNPQLYSFFWFNLMGIIFSGLLQKFPTDYDWRPDGFGEYVGELIGSFLGASLAVGCGFWLASIVWLIVFSVRKGRQISRKRKEKTERLSQLGAAALEEIESGTPDKALWAQALVSADGDENRARATYIRLRMKNSTKDDN